MKARPGRTRRRRGRSLTEQSEMGFLQGVGSLLRRRPDWNRCGPHVPLWFHRRLRWLSRSLVIQYTPARSLQNPQGVPVGICPEGMVSIFFQLPRSKFLHPTAIWSLVDERNRYKPPTIQDFRNLETAWYLYRARRVPEFLKKMEELTSLIEKAKEDDSKDDMIHWLGELARAWCDRQWTNRAFFPRGAESNGVPAEPGRAKRPAERAAESA